MIPPELQELQAYKAKLAAVREYCEWTAKNSGIDTRRDMAQDILDLIGGAK